MFSGPSLRGVSARSHCRTLTPPGLQGAETVVWTRLIRTAAFSEPGGRTPGDTATPPRTGPTVTNHLTCQKDTVSYTFSMTHNHTLHSVAFPVHSTAEGPLRLPLFWFFSKQSRERRCRARCTSSTRRQVSAPGTTPGYRGTSPGGFSGRREQDIWLLLLTFDLASLVLPQGSGQRELRGVRTVTGGLGGPEHSVGPHLLRGPQQQDHTVHRPPPPHHHQVQVHAPTPPLLEASRLTGSQGSCHMVDSESPCCLLLLQPAIPSKGVLSSSPHGCWGG